MELVTGAGLAFSAGLNAYVPMLILGLSARFFGVVHLPAAWAWLSDPWVLGILAILLVLEIVADKIPVVDSVNNVVQTVVRPAAGGIVFGSSSGSTTTLVSDPAKFFTTGGWIPVAVGVLIALASHTTKSVARPVLNAASFGTAAPIVSTVEDVSSIGLSVFAIVVPVLALILIAVGIIVFVIVIRRARRKAKERAAARARKQRLKRFSRRGAEPAVIEPTPALVSSDLSTLPPVSTAPIPSFAARAPEGLREAPNPASSSGTDNDMGVLVSVQGRLLGAASVIRARVKRIREP